MKSTPITFMEQTTAIQQRRQATVLLQAETYKCLSDHPMEEKVEGHTKNRLKRSSFTHEVKKLQKDYPTVLTIPTLPLSKQDFTNPCENTTSEIQIKTTIPQLDQGKELDASIYRLYRNHSKSEVIGRCSGMKKQITTQNRHKAYANFVYEN